MSGWIVPIVVAVIAGPIMWLLHRLDRRNTEQHGQSVDMLRNLDGKVDGIHGQLGRLEEKMDAHHSDNRRHR